MAIDTKILLSIIIPVYNLEHYIGKCISALLLEDLSGVEILIVDDGSTDSSYYIVSHLLDGAGVTHHVIQQENSGVSIARNNGIKKAKGEYIYFLDGDDVVSQGCLAKIKAHLVSGEYSLIRFGYTITDENLNVIPTASKEVGYLDYEISCKELLMKAIKRECSIWLGGMIFSKQIIEDNDINFHVGARYGEDVEFLYKYMICSANCFYIYDSLVSYVQRSSSAMSAKRIEIFDPVYAYDRVYQFCTEHRVDKSICHAISSICIPETVVHCITRGIKDGVINLNSISVVREMKNRLRKVSYLAFAGNIKMMLSIFMLKNFPVLFLHIVTTRYSEDNSINMK